MHTETQLHSSDQVLVNSLTPEQIMAVAEWMGIETKLRTEDHHGQQVRETLECMAERLRELAPKSKYYTKPSNNLPKGYMVSYLELF
ncbi:MAG: hypothetical protein ACFB14_18485 [Leptolyngbyaceae cyanobacterium]